MAVAGQGLLTKGVCAVKTHTPLLFAVLKVDYGWFFAVTRLSEGAWWDLPPYLKSGLKQSLCQRKVRAIYYPEDAARKISSDSFRMVHRSAVFSSRGSLHIPEHIGNFIFFRPLLRLLAGGAFGAADKGHGLTLL